MDQSRAFKTVKEYFNFLKDQKYNVSKAYIFGSYANGKYDEDSDIDLAIIFSRLKNSFLMQIELMKLSRKFDTKIEPHPFDEADFNESNPLANEILTNGIEVI